MSKNPPDWWARSFGIVGILIALGGLGFSYFNYRFQTETYAKSQEERVLVQLSAEYNLSKLVWVMKGKTARKLPQGQLAVEVVNLGMQPMYLKKISADVNGHEAHFYEHDPMKTEPMRRLEPGEGADYKLDWQELSVDEIGREGKGIVEVETTKKQFSQPTRVNKINVVSDVQVFQLLQLIPGKLERPQKK